MPLCGEGIRIDRISEMRESYLKVVGVFVRNCWTIDTVKFAVVSALDTNSVPVRIGDLDASLLLLSALVTARRLDGIVGFTGRF